MDYVETCSPLVKIMRYETRYVALRNLTEAEHYVTTMGPTPNQLLGVEGQLCREEVDITIKPDRQARKDLGVGPKGGSEVPEKRITADSKAVSGGELHGLALLVDDGGSPVVSQIIERNIEEGTVERRLILEDGETYSSFGRANIWD